MAKRAAFGLFVFAAVLAPTAWWAQRNLAEHRRSAGVLLDQAKTPLLIEPELAARIDIPSGPVLSRVSRLLWPARSDSLVKVLHAIHCLPEGSKPPDPGRPSMAELRSLLLDMEASRRWYGGELSLIETRHGVRFVTSGGLGGQAHLNQCLSVLAESGVPLQSRINSPRGTFTVENILADAIATFDPASEIEWTSNAIALYWPPRTRWRNKFNEQFDFDKLVRTLVSRRLDNRSCSGTHVLYSLALLFRVDRRQPILGRETRELLTSFLGRVRDQVTSHQRKDGAVELLWFNTMLEEAWYTDLVASLGNPRSKDGIRAVQKDMHAAQDWSDLAKRDLGSRFSLVLSTGHHLEWLIMLPAQMQPNRDFFDRSLRFLNAALQEAAESEIRDGFCPYGHAARVLQLLSVSEAPGGDGH